MNCCEINDLFSFSDKICKCKSETSNNKRFNIIKALVRGNLHETSHSRVLAELLNTDERILKSFINEFVDPCLNKDEVSKITVETDNIDIVIEGENFVIIIENKVNNASEQPHQIDRYVKLKMEEDPGRKIYVLYLTRDYPAPPSDYSWLDTRDKCQIVLRTYRKHVRDWVNKLYESEDWQYSLHSALYQYRNYLDCIFENDTMKVPEDIIQKINEYLENKGKYIVNGKINAIDNLCSDLNETYEICKTYGYLLKWEDIKKRITKEVEKRGLKIFNDSEMVWNLPDIGIPFQIGSSDQFYAVVSYLQQRYIGIIHYNNSGSVNDQIVDKLKKILPGMDKESVKIWESKIYSTARYPVWFKVDNDDNLVNQYLQLVDTLKNNKCVKILDKVYPECK